MTGCRNGSNETKWTGNSVAIAAADTAGLPRMAEYMLPCPFSLERIISVNDDGNVVYRAEKAHCQAFPAPGDETLHRGVPRNFEVFDPLDFIAEITQHTCLRRGRRGRQVPDPGMQLLRYYGWYSNKAEAGGRNPRVGKPVTRR